jgi:hypothetical protein
MQSILDFIAQNGKDVCLQILNTSFGVKDNLQNAPTYSVRATPELINRFKTAKQQQIDFTEWHFLIENLNEVPIHFLAIDACLLHNQAGGQCDFAAFTEKTFILVDIKDVKTKLRNQSIEKAVEQLANTFKLFKTFNVFPTDLQKFAIVGLTFKEYANQSHPKAKTSRFSDIKRFYDDFQATFLVINAFLLEDLNKLF